MRVFALFLCLFLLLISLGTLTYVYILWNTYWIRVAKLNEERVYMRQQQNAVRILQGDDQVWQCCFAYATAWIVIYSNLVYS